MSAPRFVGWLVGWLESYLVGWLVGWLIGRLVGWLVGWLAGWLASLLALLSQIAWLHFDNLLCSLVACSRYLLAWLARFARLNTRNSTKRRLPASFGWVSGVQVSCLGYLACLICFVCSVCLVCFASLPLLASLLITLIACLRLL